MPDNLQNSRTSLLAELQRRNVFRVALVYVAVGWITMQVVDTMAPALQLPEWIPSAIALLLIVGFPLALVFAWAYELTPEGLKKEREVDRAESITRETGRKLDFIIIGALAVAVVFLLVDKFAPQSDSPEQITDTSEDTESRVAADNTIAVLPFADMSPAKDQEYFTDGLTENLLHALAQIREIKVAGRTSSFAFKDRKEVLSSIGEQLRVRNILEGSVRKSGDQIRVTAQLVDTRDGFHLWSNTFNRELNDVFAVQDEITTAVVAALRKTMLGDTEVATGYNRNAYAYNAYLQGRFFDSKRNLESWDRAIEQFEAALEIDPNMALAWAGLSDAIADKTGFTAGESSFAEGYEKAREAAVKALALDAGLPEAHVALGQIQRYYDWDWRAAERSYRRALDLRPGDPDIRSRLAGLLANRGKVDEALPEIEQVLALDPLNPTAQIARIWNLVFLDRLDTALIASKHLTETAPNTGTAFIQLAVVHGQRGEHELALEAAQQEKFPYLKLTGEAIYYDKLGASEEAQQSVDQLIAEYGEDVSYQLAAIHSMWGDLDRAFEWLERGFEARDPGLINIRVHTSFDPLREDPRYGAFLEKMGLN